MSETSETKGRCRSEVDMSGSGGPVTNAIADAIDRLAADVAAVKEAVCDRSGWPVGWLIEVDRLIRLRDEARAEVERLKAGGNQAPDDLGILRDARGLSERCSELASRIAMQQIEARAEKVKAELEQKPPAAPQPAGHGISPKVAGTQPTGNAAPAAGWLTEEERELLQSRSRALRRWLVGRLPPPLEVTREVDLIDGILARAGSPPVVEVPELPSNHYARSEAERYRAALDKAGLKWKEVGRE